MIGYIILLVVLVGIPLWIMSIYNGLVTLRNQYKNAFAQIDIQLKRRYDLIPNLVETAKGYMAHEKDTLEAVITARNAAYTSNQRAASNPSDGAAVTALNQSESALSGAMSRFMMVSEAYPELKANTNMLQLSEELTSTENKVGFARQAYNDSVTAYNTGREQFPAVIVANNFGFAAAVLLEAIEAPEERQAPKIKF